MSADMGRFDHVGLNVADLDAMVEWYENTLDMRTEMRFELSEVSFTGVMLRSDAGYRIELLHRVGNQAGMQPSSAVDAALTRGFGHIALDVPDVDAAYERLMAAGASDRMSPRPSPDDGVRMAYVADPEGNLIEVINRTAVRGAP